MSNEELPIQNDDKDASSPSESIQRQLRVSTSKIAEEQEFKITDTDGNSIDSIVFVDFSEEDHQPQLDQAISDLVTSSEEVNNRRQSVNHFFLTINTVLLGGSGWLFSNFLQTLQLFQAFQLLVGIFVVSTIGMILCYLWSGFLRSFWCVSRSKVETMKSLESKRHVRVFTAQYKLVEANDYTPLTKLESDVAKIFNFLHGLTFVVTIILLLCILFNLLSF